MAWLVTWPGSLAFHETVLGHQYEISGDADTPDRNQLWGLGLSHFSLGKLSY